MELNIIAKTSINLVLVKFLSELVLLGLKK